MENKKLDVIVERVDMNDFMGSAYFQNVALTMKFARRMDKQEHCHIEILPLMSNNEIFHEKMVNELNRRGFTTEKTKDGKLIVTWDLSQLDDKDKLPPFTESDYNKM